jgi:hypothetical protein
MFTNGFNTEGLFTMPKVEKGNELNRFCKLEGMDYQQLVSEVHGIKSQPVKSRNMKLFSAFSNRFR